MVEEGVEEEGEKVEEEVRAGEEEMGVARLMIEDREGMIGSSPRLFRNTLAMRSVVDSHLGWRRDSSTDFCERRMTPSMTAFNDV